MRGRPRPAAAAAHAEVAAGKGVGVAEGPHGDHLDRPRRRCRAGGEDAAGLVAVAPGPEVQAPPSDQRIEPDERPSGPGRRPAPARHRPTASGDGKRWVSAAAGVGDRFAHGGTTTGGVDVRAAAVETCWPRTARTASSGAVDGAGHPTARAPCRPAGARTGSAPSTPSTAIGIGVEVQQPAAAGDGRGEVAQVGERRPGTRCGRGVGVSSTMPGPWASRSVRR